MPTEGTSLKPLSDVPVVDNIEHAFSLMDAPTLEQVRIGLKLFNYGSILIGLHFARFVHLSVEQRLDYIGDGKKAWRSSGGSRPSSRS